MAELKLEGKAHGVGVEGDDNTRLVDVNSQQDRVEAAMVLVLVSDLLSSGKMEGGHLDER